MSNKLLAFLLLVSASFAINTSTGPYSECPAGDYDCFNCGAPPKSVACSYSCAGLESVCTCGYDWCECYCPYSGSGDSDNEQSLCSGVNCPSYCSGSTYYYGGDCDSSTGNCGYSTQNCQYGCDDYGCNDAPQEEDLCKGVSCPTKCDGTTYLYNGRCDPGTGKCAYSSESCDYSCDAKKGCGGDPCENIACADKCVESEHKMYLQGVCNPNSIGLSSKPMDFCDYGRVEDCETCFNSTTCMEVCDNSKDDDFDTLTDCDDPQCRESYACSCKNPVNHGLQEGKLNIVLVGTDYEERAVPQNGEKDNDKEFEKSVNDVVEAFRTISPFSDEYSKINIFATRVVGVKDKYSRAEAVASVRCGTNQNDKYIIIDATNPGLVDPFAPICGGRVYIHSDTYDPFGNVAMHEFGHAFGCLWDEYEYDTQPREWYEFGWKSLIYEFQYEGHLVREGSLGGGFTNCAPTPYSVFCKEQFGQWSSNFECIPGCTAPKWFRPSNNSIMRSPSVNYFNDVSKEIIKKMLSKYT